MALNDDTNSAKPKKRHLVTGWPRFLQAFRGNYWIPLVSKFESKIQTVTLNNSGEKKSRDARSFIITGYVLLFLLFGVFGVWAAFAKIDKAVVASGTISVSTNNKEIQHLEGGIVEKVNVKEGQLVQAGDMLVEISDVQARANLQVITLRLNTALAVETRLIAERNLQEKPAFADFLLMDNTIKSLIADQMRIFTERYSLLKSQLDILENRVSQYKREIQGLDEQQSAYLRRADILLERLERLRDGAGKGIVQTNLLSSHEDQYIEIKANTGRLESEKAKVSNLINETNLQIIQAKQQFKERASTEYKDISSQIKELGEQKTVALDTLARTKVRAPVQGVAQNLQINGGVIKPGQVLMEIVPLSENLIINAHVPINDIDNVHIGMKAEVKFPAFPSHNMPIILGEINTISKSSIVPSDARFQPYYLAQININRDMVPDRILSRLSPGMQADVLISSGERTALNYLISPLYDAVHKSMREE